jgi:helix-turn-helix, Psq domain
LDSTIYGNGYFCHSTTLQQGMSIRKAAESFGVPKSTLERHPNKNVAFPGCHGRRQPVLDAFFEAHSANAVKILRLIPTRIEETSL